MLIEKRKEMHNWCRKMVCGRQLCESNRWPTLSNHSRQMSDFNPFRYHSENDDWQSQDLQQLLDSGVRLTPPTPFAGSIPSIETPNEGFSTAQGVRTDDDRRLRLLRSESSVLTPGWDGEGAHEEDQPPYTVEWKVKLKN